MTATILIGDCRERLKELADNSIDACVCDPPYHLTSKGAHEQGHPSWNGMTKAVRAKRGFMGQEWDGGDVAFQPETWAEVLRVLKPGGHLVAFSGTRTYHRMTVAIEDAGFEVRDQLAWIYGSGFPKSLDVSKAIDKAAGHARGSEYVPNFGNDVFGRGLGGGKHGAQSEPAVTEAAQQWQGWGTALKPSWEPICLARKPLSEGSVAANVLRFGTGAINVDACRITPHAEQSLGGSPEASGRGIGPHELRSLRQAGQEVEKPTGTGEVGHHLRPSLPQRDNEGAEQSELEGWLGLVRNPNGLSPSEHRQVVGGGQGIAANAGAEGISGAPASDGSLFGAPAATGGARSPSQRGKGRQPAGEPGTDGLVGAQPGAPSDGASSVEAPSGEPSPQGTNSGVGTPLGRWPSNICHDGSDEVLAGFPETESGSRKAGDYGVLGGDIYGRAAVGPMPALEGDSGSAARFFYCAKATTEERGEGNNHPTVKPKALMEWLIKLVTPPGGTVLDPFMGSGSTGLAADALQFDFIGCEMSPEYAAIAERRIREAAGMFADVKVAA